MGTHGSLMIRRIAALVPLAALGLLAAPVPAQAATYTSSGVRCTKVGTAGADRLTGTAGRDVICGLGGDDVISGLGGDDLIDGGPGEDTLRGDDGNDQILGSSGDDTASGGAGADKITAGSGNDTLDGGLGGDTLSGGTGRDKLSGGDGVDRLSGGADPDREYGGPGHDTLAGGDGDDALFGQDGNDDLSGNAGSDDLDGGAGTNWCTVGSTDTEKACVYDTQAPTATVVGISPSTVDVTLEGKRITVRLQVKDDTGVTSVQVNSQDFETADIGPRFGMAHLVEGTVRNGIWEANGYAPRYSLPGDFEFDIFARDRVGRSGGGTIFSPTIKVKDATPDRQNAKVVSFSLDKSKVDVRTSNGRITASVRVIDDASGAADGEVYLCLVPAVAQTGRACDLMDRYKGTARDGWWHVTATIEEGDLGGDWNASVHVSDEVHRGSPEYYFGEDVYRRQMENGGDPVYHRLPGGGRFTVIGASDNTAARAVGLTTDVTHVDTLPSARSVTLLIDAKDAAGEGVTAVWASLTTKDNTYGGPDFGLEQATRVSGTKLDGRWKVVLTLPQGTPPGDYAVGQVIVEDKGHWRSYAPAGSPFAGESGQLAFPSGSVKGPGGAAWDGVVTVDDHNG